AGLAIFAVSLLFTITSWFLEPGIDPGETNPLASFSLVSSLADLLSLFITFVISAFVFRGALDEVEGRRFDLAAAFGRVPIGPVLLTSLLLSVGVSVGLVLCIVPGIVFAFLSYFALLFVVDQNRSPVDAISASAT